MTTEEPDLVAMPGTIQYLAGNRRIHCQKVYGGGYEVVQTAWVQTLIIGHPAISADGFSELGANGICVVRRGFVYDGVSWFPDFAKMMCGATFHDDLYKLMHERQLELDLRPLADTLLVDLCQADGCSAALAWGVKKAMQTKLAKMATDEHHDKVLVFPP